MAPRFPAPVSRHHLPLVKHSLRHCCEGLCRWNDGLQSVGLLGRLWRWTWPDHRSPSNLSEKRPETQEIRDLKQEKDWTHRGWFEDGGAESSPQLAISKDVETSVLPQRGTEFCLKNELGDRLFVPRSLQVRTQVGWHWAENCLSITAPDAKYHSCELMSRWWGCFVSSVFSFTEI